MKRFVRVLVLLRIFAKNALCILELKVVSFTGFMKYVK